MLRRHVLPPDRFDRALEVIWASCHQQQTLIDDLLDMSRITSGKLALRPAVTVLPDLVLAAFEVTAASADGKQMHMTLELDPSVVRYECDPDRVRQALWNLLSNAVKFTPRGGRIAVRLVRTERDIMIQVSDSGIGIAPAFLPHVFDAFRQGDSSSTRPYGGLGLGLAIARRVIQLHGGEITAESGGPGSGASFAIHLPVDVAPSGVY
jgi:signal transduction histidine kinase